MLFPHWILITPGSSTSHTQSLWVLETQLLTCNMHPVGLNHWAEALDPAHAMYLCPNLLCMTWASCSDPLIVVLHWGFWKLVQLLDDSRPWVPGRWAVQTVWTSQVEIFLPFSPWFITGCHSSWQLCLRLWSLAHFQMLNTRLQSQSESTAGELLWHYCGVTDTRIRLSMQPLE